MLKQFTSQFCIFYPNTNTDTSRVLASSVVHRVYNHNNSCSTWNTAVKGPAFYNTDNLTTQHVSHNRANRNRFASYQSGHTMLIPSKWIDKFSPTFDKIELRIFQKLRDFSRQKEIFETKILLKRLFQPVILGCFRVILPLKMQILHDDFPSGHSPAIKPEANINQNNSDSEPPYTKY